MNDVMEDIGYKKYVDADGLLKKLKELNEPRKTYKSRPYARLKFNNGEIYKIRIDTAMELVKNGKAEILEIFE